MVALPVRMLRICRNSVKTFRQLAFASAIIAVLCGNELAEPGPLALQLNPVYTDVERGYAYFLVRNRWNVPINALYGRIYGYDDQYYLVNNPNVNGLKVSLGDHVPGSAALYRFKIYLDRKMLSQFSLQVDDRSIFSSSRMIR